MKWKTAALAALLTIAASTGAMAYDMNTLKFLTRWGSCKLR